MIDRSLRFLWLTTLASVSVFASSVTTCTPSTCGSENNHSSNSVVRSTTSALRARTYAPRPEASLQERATRTLPGYTGAFTIGGDGNTLITAMAADSAGNTLVAGGIVGAATFPTSPSPTTITSSGDSDPFVAKFNAAGQCLWVRTARGITGAPKDYSGDGALALAVDAQNNVYIGGAFVRQLDFLNAGSQVVSSLYATSGAGYNYEAFVARYDTNGALNWVQGGMSGSAKSSGLESGLNGVTSLVADASGNLFVGGTASGLSMLGATVSTSTSGSAFIGKLNPATGAPVWLTAWRDDDTEYYDGIAGIVSDQQGGVVALGFGYGSGVTFATAPSPTDVPFDEDQIAFLARFNGNGQCLWARRPATSGYIDADHIAVTPLGQVIVSGGTGGDAWFDGYSAPGPFADTYEAYIVRYDSGGAVQWVRSLLTVDGYSYATQLTVDAAGNIYFGGKYTGHTSITGNIDDGTGVVLAAPLDEDVFFAMFDAAGTPRWIRGLSAPGAMNVTYTSTTTNAVTDTGAIAYNAQARSIQLSGNFLHHIQLDNVTLNGAAGRYSSYVASIPSQDAPTGTVTNPSLRGSFTQTGWSGPTSFWADLTLTNTSASVAYNASIPSATVRTLSGGTVTLTSTFPLTFGDIPGAGSVTRRVYFTVPSKPSRFSFTGSAICQNQNAARLTTTIGATLIAN